MKNIQNYQQFVNEELRLKEIPTLIIGSTAFYGVRSILKIIQVILKLFKKKNYSEYFGAAISDFAKLQQLATFNSIHDLKFNVNKLSDEELKIYYEKLNQEYEKKYHRNLIDDIKVFLNSIKSQKKFKELYKLVDAINGRETRENDPFGEEDWDDEDEKSFTIRDIISNSRNEEEVLKKIKNLIVGKNIIFLQDNDFMSNMKFKTKIKVKDVKLNFTEIIFVDEKDKEYKSDWGIIKILD